MDESDEDEQHGTAEGLISATKPITQATAKAVAAGNSCKQQDMLAAAIIGRKSVGELLQKGRVRIIFEFLRICRCLN